MDAQAIIRQNKDVYNAIAKHFSDTREQLWDNLLPLKRFAKNGDRILDVGCGNGRLRLLFEGMSIQYTGIDQSEALIAIAKKKYPDGTFVEGKMTRLPFLDEAFDAVYCIAALHHIPTKELQLRAIEEMHRVLATGGHLVMTNWNLYSEWAKKKFGTGENGNFFKTWKDGEGRSYGDRYYYGFTPEELERLCAAAGFGMVEQYFARDGRESEKDVGNNMVTIAKKNAPHA